VERIDLAQSLLNTAPQRGIYDVRPSGGDESHAPARKSYEKAGHTGLPLVPYYKDLQEKTECS